MDILPQHLVTEPYQVHTVPVVGVRCSSATSQYNNKCIRDKLETGRETETSWVPVYNERMPLEKRNGQFEGPSVPAIVFQIKG